MTVSSPTDGSVSAPLIALAVGAMATMAALVALVVAGVAGGALFPATGSASAAAADRGIWTATQAWANPLALAGAGVIFGVAIPLAVRNIRSAIDHRRAVMVAALPSLIQGASQ